MTEYITLFILLFILFLTLKNHREYEKIGAKMIRQARFIVDMLDIHDLEYLHQQIHKFCSEELDRSK